MQHTTPVCFNGEFLGIFAIAQLLNLKFFLYLYWLGVGSSPLKASRRNVTSNVKKNEMKKTFLLIFLFSNLTFGQYNGEIILNKNVTLKWEIKNFEKTKHTFEYCKLNDWKYICKIDNQDWFGSDFGMEFPKNELTKLSLIIGTENYDLETSKMYNPNFSGYLSSNQFKLVDKGNYKILYSFYSDGAGSYSAHWKIENGKAERIILSRDEIYFEWQNE